MDRLARQAYDQIPAEHRLTVADAIVQLAHEGIPRGAEPLGDGHWWLATGAYVLYFTENELDIYLNAIERA